MARELIRNQKLETRNLKLKISHLYPDMMDTYGDTGNIITLQKRCEWRGIKTTVSNISLREDINDDFDLYFFGGGQDKSQEIVSLDLQKKSKVLKKAVDDGSVILSICGGYQLLQKYFKTKKGKIIKGIGIFDAYTVGSNDRMTQNLLIEINNDISVEIEKIYPTTSLPNYQSTQLVGFENHSGKTYLEKGAEPLGRVINGSGNNGEDKTEGAVYKNAFGCYLHGSLLPKNVHFADYLIAKALERRYGIIKLEPIDDEIEWQAHQAAVKRTRSSG